MAITRRNFLVFSASSAGACMLPGTSSLLAAPARMASVSAIHFSPTGTCDKIANHLGNALAGQVSNIDLATQTFEKHILDGRSYAVVVMPVYYGRLPARAVEALRLIQGNGTPCISIAVYGNRAIDDALLELNDILTEQGFFVFSSGAFVAQHAIIKEIGEGRPDAEDLAALDAFALDILAEANSGRLAGPPKVPGNRPYKKNPPASGLTPLVADNCIDCGACAEKCPVTAIPADNFRTTDTAKCMLCMRCVRICPVGARALPPKAQEQLVAYMAQYKARRYPETYL